MLFVAADNLFSRKVCSWLYFGGAKGHPNRVVTMILDGVQFTGICIAMNVQKIPSSAIGVVLYFPTTQFLIQGSLSAWADLINKRILAEHKWQFF